MADGYFGHTWSKADISERVMAQLNSSMPQKRMDPDTRRWYRIVRVEFNDSKRNKTARKEVLEEEERAARGEASFFAGDELPSEAIMQVSGAAPKDFATYERMQRVYWFHDRAIARTRDLLVRMGICVEVDPNGGVPPYGPSTGGVPGAGRPSGGAAAAAATAGDTRDPDLPAGRNIEDPFRGVVYRELPKLTFAYLDNFRRAAVGNERQCRMGEACLNNTFSKFYPDAISESRSADAFIGRELLLPDEEPDPYSPNLCLRCEIFNVQMTVFANARRNWEPVEPVQRFQVVTDQPGEYVKEQCIPVERNNGTGNGIWKPFPRYNEASYVSCVRKVQIFVKRRVRFEEEGDAVEEGGKAAGSGPGCGERTVTLLVRGYTERFLNFCFAPAT